MSVPTSTNLPRSGLTSDDDDGLKDFDGAAEILRAWGSGLRPDPDLTVSEWADRHRMLSGRASAEPGRYRTGRTPYMREIMDRLSPGDPTQRIVFMKAAQVGATEAGNNWIGFAIHQAPGPMLAVQPTVELAKRNSRQRIDPLIDESPELRERVKPARSRDAGNTMLSKEFAGEPPRVYRRAKLSENCPSWNRHQRRRPRSRIHPSSANVRCGWRWNTAMIIKAKLRR